jgi:hypothetical protein
MICGRCRIQIDRKDQWSDRRDWIGSDLSRDMKRYLNATRYEGLCSNCRQFLQSQVSKAACMTLPINSSDFDEGLHYTVELGKIVFTEFYHIQRGYCCGSGCKHCAYGFVPIPNHL